VASRFTSHTPYLTPLRATDLDRCKTAAGWTQTAAGLAAAFFLRPTSVRFWLHKKESAA
jgi:hypothetical protein